ncbi:hypothetical protein ACLB2K_014217 [Fragaria x ananassa]
MKPQLFCLKHRSPQYKPHDSVASRSLTAEQVLAQFGNPNISETTMVGSQPTQGTGYALPMEQILQMFEELKGRLEATSIQQSITDLAEKVNDLAEQVKRDKVLWKADRNNLAILNEDFNEHFLAKKIELSGRQSNGKST